MSIPDDILKIKDLIPKINLETDATLFIAQVSELDKRVQNVTFGDEHQELTTLSSIEILQPLKDISHQLKSVMVVVDQKPKDVIESQSEHLHKITSKLQKVISASEKFFPMFKEFQICLKEATANGEAVSEKIAKYNFPEEMCAKIAIAAAKQNPEAFLKYFKNYKITNPLLLFRIAVTLFENVDKITLEIYKQANQMLPKIKELRDISSVAPEFVKESIYLYGDDFCATHLFSLNINDSSFLSTNAIRLIEEGQSQKIKMGLLESIKAGTLDDPDLIEEILIKLAERGGIEWSDITKIYTDKTKQEIFALGMYDKSPEWARKNLSLIAPIMDKHFLNIIADHFYDSAEVLDSLPILHKLLTKDQYKDLVVRIFNDPNPQLDSEGNIKYDGIQKKIEGLAAIHAKKCQSYFNNPPHIASEFEKNPELLKSFNYIEATKDNGFKLKLTSTKGPNEVITHLLEIIQKLASLPENEGNCQKMLEWVVLFDLLCRGNKIPEPKLIATLPILKQILDVRMPSLRYPLTDFIFKEIFSEKGSTKTSEQLNKILKQEHTALFRLMLTPLIEENPDENWDFVEILNDKFFINPNKQNAVLAALNALNGIPSSQASTKEKFRVLKEMFICSAKELELLKKERNEKDDNKAKFELINQQLGYLTFMIDRDVTKIAKFTSSEEFLSSAREDVIDKYKFTSRGKTVKLIAEVEAMRNVKPKSGEYDTLFKQLETTQQARLIFSIFHGKLLDFIDLPPRLHFFEGLPFEKVFPFILADLQAIQKIKDSSLTDEGRKNLTKIISELEFSKELFPDILTFEQLSLNTKIKLLKFPQKNGKPIGSMILPGGYPGHAVLYKIDMNETGCRFSVINTGGGATRISTRPSKSRGIARINRDEVYSGNLELKDLSAKFFEELFKLKATAKSMDDIYAFLDKSLLREGVKKIAGPERIMQTKGTCVIRCIHALIQEGLGKELFREYDVLAGERAKVSAEEYASRITPFVKSILFPTIQGEIYDEEAVKEHMQLFFEKGSIALQRKKNKIKKITV